MDKKGEKRILGRSSFSLLIENLSERLRNTSKEPTGIWKYFNTTTTKGKRNVVLLCYAFGFIGLHVVWQRSKRNKTAGDENAESKTSWSCREATKLNKARETWYENFKPVVKKTIFIAQHELSSSSHCHAISGNGKNVAKIVTKRKTCKISLINF